MTHPQPALVRRGDERVERREVPEERVDVAVVGHVVPVVGLRRAVHRREPHGVDAQAGDGVEPGGQTRQVTDAVAVPVQEGADVDLVDDGGAPPAELTPTAHQLDQHDRRVRQVDVERGPVQRALRDREPVGRRAASPTARRSASRRRRTSRTTAPRCSSGRRRPATRAPSTAPSGRPSSATSTRCGRAASDPSTLHWSSVPFQSATATRSSSRDAHTSTRLPRRRRSRSPRPRRDPAARAATAPTTAACAARRRSAARTRRAAAAAAGRAPRTGRRPPSTTGRRCARRPSASRATRNAAENTPSLALPKCVGLTPHSVHQICASSRPCRASVARRSSGRVAVGVRRDEVDRRAGRRRRGRGARRPTRRPRSTGPPTTRLVVDGPHGAHRHVVEPPELVARAAPEHLEVRLVPHLERPARRGPRRGRSGRRGAGPGRVISDDQRSQSFGGDTIARVVEHRHRRVRRQVARHVRQLDDGPQARARAARRRWRRRP